MESCFPRPFLSQADEIKQSIRMEKLPQKLNTDKTGSFLLRFFSTLKRTSADQQILNDYFINDPFLFFQCFLRIFWNFKHIDQNLRFWYNLKL